MMMMVAGTMIGGRAAVMELVVPMVMAGVMIGVMIGVMVGIMRVGIQRNVREHHVLMVVLAHHGMLQISHNAGGGCLGEHKQQGDTQHRPGAPEERGPPGSHGNSLSDLVLATRPPAHVQGDAGTARMACTHK